MSRSVFNNGGLIGVLKIPNASSASGIWSLSSALEARASDTWPTFVMSGQQIYTTPGTYNFTVPDGVTTLSLVGIGAGGTGDDGNSSDGGGGGGGGGALAYANNVTVTPGMTIVVTVGARSANTSVKNTRAPNGGNTTINISSFIMYANGGTGGAPYSTNPGSVGGTFGFVNIPAGANTGGGFGGTGGGGFNGGGGGGGAGGYTGFGANGSYSSGGTFGAPVGYGAGGGGGASFAATAGLNGGGSGGAGQQDITGGGGGGATIFSASNPAANGTAGNGLQTTGSRGGDGGWPGGGGGGSWDNGSGFASFGANGAVKIIWGTGRSFPYNATDV